VKIPGPTEVNPPWVTLIGPETAPAGTVASIRVEEMTAPAAVIPLEKVTTAELSKLTPEMETVDPTGPAIGENEITVGAFAG